MRQACLVMRVLSGSPGSASSPGPALPRAGMAGGADPELLKGLAMVTSSGVWRWSGCQELPTVVLL